MPENVSRRELNRERTRDALYEAVLTLVETRGLDALTADSVADAAGVSRRTFFNYYPSVDALITAGVEQLLSQLSAAMVARPDDEALPDSVLAVVDEVVTTDVLASLTRAWRAIDESAAASRYAMEMLANHNEALAHDWAHERLRRTGIESDSLQESVVMGAYGAAFEAARHHWLRAHEGPIDDDARRRFLATVRRAFDLIRPITETG